MTRPPKSKAIERLQKALSQMPRLKELSTDNPEFRKWRRNTEIAIANAFGEKSRHVEDFTKISYVPPVPEIQLIRDGKIVPSRSASDCHDRYLGGLVSAATLLESMIEEIEEYWEDEGQAQISSSLPRDERTNTNKVFVVHGRDDGTRQVVARFIEKLDLEPVLLDEQADKGRTIIEKFEQEAEEVRFAVILLTPDDEGRLRSEEAELKPRARQNVIFELGYFWRALGPNRVCALKKGEVETPSDYDGVIYIPLDDAEGWKMGLIRELKAAGFDVDANRVL